MISHAELVERICTYFGCMAKFHRGKISELIAQYDAKQQNEIDRLKAELAGVRHNLAEAIIERRQAAEQQTEIKQLKEILADERRVHISGVESDEMDW